MDPSTNSNSRKRKREHEDDIEEQRAPPPLPSWTLEPFRCHEPSPIRPPEAFKTLLSPTFLNAARLHHGELGTNNKNLFDVRKDGQSITCTGPSTVMPHFNQELARVQSTVCRPSITNKLIADTLYEKGTLPTDVAGLVYCIYEYEFQGCEKATIDHFPEQFIINEAWWRRYRRQNQSEAGGSNSDKWPSQDNSNKMVYASSSSSYSSDGVVYASSSSSPPSSSAAALPTHYAPHPSIEEEWPQQSNSHGMFCASSPSDPSLSDWAAYHPVSPQQNQMIYPSSSSPLAGALTYSSSFSSSPGALDYSSARSSCTRIVPPEVFCPALPQYLAPPDESNSGRYWIRNIEHEHEDDLDSFVRPVSIIGKEKQSGSNKLYMHIQMAELY